MRIRPTVTVTTAAIGLSLALTGCGVVGDIGARDATPTGTPSPTTSPKDILTKAAKALDGGTYSFQFRRPDTLGVGSVDGRDGWLRLSRIGGGADEPDVTFEVLNVDGHNLIRSNPLTADQWTRLDVKKIDPARRRSLVEVADPGHADRLFAGIVSVEEIRQGSYRGTMNLSKVTGANASHLVDEEHLRSLDHNQTTGVPFEANVDRQGRLLGIRLTLPAGGGKPEQPAEISYSRHGVKPDLRGPLTGRIEPTPESLYKLLNS